MVRQSQGAELPIPAVEERADSVGPLQLQHPGDQDGPLLSAWHQGLQECLLKTRHSFDLAP